MLGDVFNKIYMDEDLLPYIKELEFSEYTPNMAPIANYGEYEGDERFKKICATASFYMFCCLIGNYIIMNKAKSYENFNYYQTIKTELTMINKETEYLQGLRYMQDYVLNKRNDLGILLISCYQVAVLNQMVEDRAFVEEVNTWFLKERSLAMQNYISKNVNIFKHCIINTGKIPNNSEISFMPYFGYWGDLCGKTDAVLYINGILYIMRDRIDNSVLLEDKAELYMYVILNKLAKKIVDGELIDKTISGLAVYNMRSGSLQCCFLSDLQLNQIESATSFIAPKLEKEAQKMNVALINYNTEPIHQKLMDETTENVSELREQRKQAKFDLNRQKKKIKDNEEKQFSSGLRFKNALRLTINLILCVLIFIGVYTLVILWFPNLDIVNYFANHWGLAKIF